MLPSAAPGVPAVMVGPGYAAAVTDDPGSTDAPDEGRAAAHGRRVVLYGADTDAGRTIAEALREAGARLGLTSAGTDGAALFALKRAAAGGPTQAVDLGNATNVRVATRKLAKALGGVDAAVVVPGVALSREALQAVLAIASREIRRSRSARTGDGRIVVIADAVSADESWETGGVPLDVIAPAALPQRLAGLVQSLVGQETGADSSQP